MSTTNGPGPGEFGRLVKRYREARSLSAERLSAMAGKSKGYVTQLETGKRGKRPSRDSVIALAQALRVDPVEFLRAAGRIEPTDELGPEHRMSFEDFVDTDPALRSDQKGILIDLYRSWVGRGSAPPSRSTTAPSGAEQ